jgi:Glycosyl hydrolase family 79 C-terminal beta domain
MMIISRLLKNIALTVLVLPLLGCGVELMAAQSATSTIILRLSETQVSMASTGSASITVTATPPSGAKVASGAAGCGTQLESTLPSGVTAVWGKPSSSSSGVVTWKLSLASSKITFGAKANVVIAAHITDSKTGKVYTTTQPMTVNVAAAPPTLTVAAAQGSLQVTQGTSVSDVLTVTSGGSFQGAPALTVSGLPTGVKASWSSSSVHLADGTGTSTLTLLPSVGVPAEKYTFNVIASGDGVTVTHTYSLTVKATAGIQVPVPSAISMTSMGTGVTTVTATLLPGVTASAGAATNIAKISSSLPTGVTAAWSQPTIFSNGTVQWKLTVSGSPLAIGWTGRITFAVQIADASSRAVFTQSQYASVAITHVAPTMSFSPSSMALFVGQGSSVTDAFSFATGGSFHGDIALTISGLPTGITASLSQSPVTPGGNVGSSILKLTADPSLAPKYYSFSVSAVGDGLSVYKYFNVTVEPVAGVALQVSQASFRVAPNVPATVGVTATTLNNVSLATNGSGVQAQVASQLPAGVTAQWSAPTISASGKTATWQLTLTSAANVSGGLQPVSLSTVVTDKASGMSFSANQQFSLIVSMLAQVSMGDTPGTEIPSDFMGLSYEWGNTYRFMGSDAVGVNTIHLQLMNNLSAYGSDPMMIRMGGNSTDVSGLPSTSTDGPLVSTANRLHNKWILGVNLGADNVSTAVAQAQNDMSVMPAGSLAGLEIGNEPDSYYKNGLRTSSYTFDDYITDFDTWKSDIGAAVPNAKFVGPAWGWTWLSNMSAFLANEAPSLSLVSQHFYAYSPYNQPTDVLLTPQASKYGAQAFAAEVAQAHADGLKFRIGEIGALYGSGVHGISDAFGSALWSIDTMFEFANIGVDGVNWATSSGSYDGEFSFTTGTSGKLTTYTLTGVSPMYYGMLLFQQATPNQSRLLPATVTTTANVKCWPTVDVNGTTRLTIINKDETQSGAVMVTAPGYTTAKVTRLTAPSYTSTSGVTLGGQTFDTSVDGTIQGTPQTETVEGNNGVFAIQMNITSAALVVFSN